MQHERPDKNLMRKTADCEKTTARLCAYLDGGLDAAERDDVNRHLTDCAACRAELATQRQAETALTAARFSLPPTGDLRADFYRRLQTENAVRSQRRPINWRLAVPSLAAVGLFALLWRPGQEVPTKRNETPLPAAPTKRSETPPRAAWQNLAEAEPMLRETLGGGEKEKNGASHFGREVSQSAALSPVARKTPPSLLLSLPPSALRLQVAPQSAPALMKKTPQIETPMLLASSATPERSAGIYGMTFRSELAPPQSALSVKESFYFKAATLDHGNLGEKTNRGESVNEFDAALAYQDAPASKSETFADRADAFEASEALGLPKIITGLAPAYDNSLAPGAEMDTVQMAATFGLGEDRSKSETAEWGEVDFEVRDEERGFASRTRVTGSIEQRQDGETLTIEAEADNGS